MCKYFQILYAFFLLHFLTQTIMINYWFRTCFRLFPAKSAMIVTGLSDSGTFFRSFISSGILNVFHVPGQDIQRGNHHLVFPDFY